MNERFTCLLYGPAGTGKTTMACTAPGPILLIDFDNKASLMQNIKGLIQENSITIKPIGPHLIEEDLKQNLFGKGYPAIQPKGYLEFCDVITQVERGILGQDVKTIVIDSITVLSDHLLALYKHMRALSILKIQDWAVFGEHLQAMFREVTSIPKNIIFIAHELIEKDELTGNIEYRPLLPGKLRCKVGIYFEEIYYACPSFMEGGNVKYRVLTQNDGKRVARTSRNLPPLMDMDFRLILKKGGESAG